MDLSNDYVAPYLSLPTKRAFESADGTGTISEQIANQIVEPFKAPWGTIVDINQNLFISDGLTVMPIVNLVIPDIFLIYQRHPDENRIIGPGYFRRSARFAWVSRQGWSKPVIEEGRAILTNEHNGRLILFNQTNTVDKGMAKRWLKQAGDKWLVDLRFGQDIFINITDRDEEKKEAALQLVVGGNVQDAIYGLATTLGVKFADNYKEKWGLKQLGNKVIDLNRLAFAQDIQPKITDYYITDKLDGERCMAVIRNGAIQLVSSRLESFAIETDLDVIMDGERYEQYYYPFDLLRFGTNLYGTEPFATRLERLNQICPQLNELLGTDFFRLKKFVPLTANYRAEIKALLTENKPYLTDGLIFTPNEVGYFDMKIYKYKPADKLTIDFLIMPGPKKVVPRQRKYIYALFTGIDKYCCQKLRLEPLPGYGEIFAGSSYARIPQSDWSTVPNYFPIQFSPSDNPNLYWWESDEKYEPFTVGEFSRHDNNWLLHRIRHDRTIEVSRGNYFGNNYSIAEITWMNIQYPLDLDKEQPEYFQVHENVKYKAARNYNSYVKNQVFDRLFGKIKPTDWVMDLASGKGQDYFRYAKYGVKNLLCTEIDINAIFELINRKHELCRSRTIRDDIYLLVQRMNLLDPFADNLTQLKKIEMPPDGKFSTIVCNFAFHYFVQTKQSLENVIKFIDSLIAPNGRLVLTCFNGQRIVELLTTYKGHWRGGDKYSIKQKYDGTVLQPVGQEIELLLPFSAGQFYSEWLVNVDHLSARLGKRGWTKENETSFGTFFDGYPQKLLLDEDDRQFISLYSVIVFRRTKV